MDLDIHPDPSTSNLFTSLPHIIAITVNDVGGNNTQLLRGELISILQLMVNRMGEDGHENDAIIPVSAINAYKKPLHVLFLTRTRY